MLTNSLFKDFLVENGLDVYKEESTRDIICLEFNFGTRTYEKELAHLKKLAKQAKLNYQLAKSHGHPAQIDKMWHKRRKISQLYVKAVENQSKYGKISKEDLRTYYYVNGVTVPYIFRKKNGEIKKVENIHYKRLFRSTGKAKKGSCMFIRDELYDAAYDFLYMGIEMPEENAPIVEANAYAPLSASGIVGKVKINPKNILILKDVDRFMTRDIVNVVTNAQGDCIAQNINDYTLKNTLFDGQALIDSSIFPDWGDGYVLLRHHWCKMAAFCTHIQKFFMDFFGDEYQTATVKDMFDNEHFVKDIELITTDNAMKWLKSDVSYEYWCQRVYDNGCMFGIVKTAHPSKLGRVQKMSYQMINALDEATMGEVVEESVNYVYKLKTDDEAFFDYLRKNTNFSNDFEVLIALCEQNPEFVRSQYFRDRRKAIINAYVLNLKTGKVIQNADNLVIVGNPYAMLLYGATADPNIVDEDTTFFVEDDAIQCYSERFNSGEYLAAFRSPFNSRNNLTYLHNTYSRNLDRYFELGELCIAINMNGTDFQDRNNGSDQDSDSLYTTNQKDIVTHARWCYKEYPTVVNNIPKSKNVYSNSMQDLARMDNMLSASQTDIGESSNLAQVVQSYSYCMPDKKEELDGYAVILAVLAQIAIDSAKRSFDVNVSQQIKMVKEEIDLKNNKYPAFWLGIRKDFNKANINRELHCPMNYLYELQLNKFRSDSATLPMSYFFKREKLNINKRTCKRVEELITKYSLNLNNYRIKQFGEFSDEHILLRSDFNDLIEEIRSMSISGKYFNLFSWLIDRAFCITNRVSSRKDNMSKLNKNKALLIKVLYDVNQSMLLKCFSNKNI